MDKRLNIIAFNVPYPPNYGGIIDIYYKLKALHKSGVGIVLHCFEYERPPAQELNNLCLEVHYYKRKTGLASNLSFIPYNVFSRRDKTLITNLLSNNYPILFEGLHSCYYLNDKRLSNRFKIYRESNIEHDYYRELSKAENNFVRKIFHYIEAQRFKLYQKQLAYADLMAVVSQADADYLKRVFPCSSIEYIPSFQGNEVVTSLVGSSNFLLYHAKLSVKENEKAALWLIGSVFSKIPEYRCVIAGMNPSEKLLKAASQYENIEVIPNPDASKMQSLISAAHINLLVTFQGTGLKLKLLNSLFAGRHVVVNPLMLVGSGLDSLCHVCSTATDMVSTCRQLMQIPFTTKDIEARSQLLFPLYSDDYQLKKLIEQIKW